MTSVFDGLAGVLNQVFGAPVQWVSADLGAIEVQAVFREDPVRIADEDGSEFLLKQPSLRVQRPMADQIMDGDTINPGNGKSYRVGAGHPTGSPALDSFIVFELEDLS